jgi:hypothetical protein
MRGPHCCVRACAWYSGHRGVLASSCISHVSLGTNASLFFLLAFVVRVCRIGGYRQSLTGQLQIRFIE